MRGRSICIGHAWRVVLVSDEEVPDGRSRRRHEWLRRCDPVHLRQKLSGLMREGRIPGPLGLTLNASVVAFLWRSEGATKRSGCSYRRGDRRSLVSAAQVSWREEVPCAVRSRPHGKVPFCVPACALGDLAGVCLPGRLQGVVRERPRAPAVAWCVLECLCNLCLYSSKGSGAGTVVVGGRRLRCSACGGDWRRWCSSVFVGNGCRCSCGCGGASCSLKGCRNSASGELREVA